MPNKTQVKQVNITLNLDRQRDKAFYDVLCDSGKRKKEFLMRAVEAYVGGDAKTVKKEAEKTTIDEIVKAVRAAVKEELQAAQIQPKASHLEPSEMKERVTQAVNPEVKTEPEQVVSEIPQEVMNFLDQLGV